jgi:hypothetical protein
MNLHTCFHVFNSFLSCTTFLDIVQIRPTIINLILCNIWVNDLGLVSPTPVELNHRLTSYLIDNYVEMHCTNANLALMVD